MSGRDTEGRRHIVDRLGVAGGVEGQDERLAWGNGGRDCEARDDGIDAGEEGEAEGKC